MLDHQIHRRVVVEELADDLLGLCFAIDVGRLLDGEVDVGMKCTASSLELPVRMACTTLSFTSSCAETPKRSRLVTTKEEHSVDHVLHLLRNLANTGPS
jgi:hypothetical protein